MSASTRLDFVETNGTREVSFFGSFASPLLKRSLFSGAKRATIKAGCKRKHQIRNDGCTQLSMVKSPTQFFNLLYINQTW